MEMLCNIIGICGNTSNDEENDNDSNGCGCGCNRNGLILPNYPNQFMPRRYRMRR